MQTFYMDWACSQKVVEDLIASGYGVWAKKADEATLLDAYIRAVKLSQIYAARALEKARKGRVKAMVSATLAVGEVLDLLDAIETRFLAGKDIGPSDPLYGYGFDETLWGEDRPPDADADWALPYIRDSIALTRTVYAQRGIMDFVSPKLLACSRTVLEPRDWLLVYLSVPDTERTQERGLHVWLEYDFDQVDGSYLDDAKALRLPLPV